MKKLFKYLLYILPLVLGFSYHPLIKLGENETMYFELSLPLLWLVVFDALGFILVVRKYRTEIFTKIFGSVLWWLFPLFVTFSVIWSLNPLRGVLTVGVMWTLFFAVLFMHELREYLDAKFLKVFFRWFFSSALVACVWCFLQCILDVFGVSQETTLLCDGCVYQMFGFPRANGFAIEPQFMGNLLLAPTILSIYFYFKNNDKKYLILFAIFTITLFLTFSRGAIYAAVVGLLFLAGFEIFRARKIERRERSLRVLKGAGVFILAFLFTLNLQGVFSALSPTSDTYFSGVSKVINQLSLGIIDIRNAEESEALQSEVQPVENSEITEGGEADSQNQVVENSGENSSIFDGYVAESTDTRMRLFNAALTVWRQDFKTAMIGVGIGGAGQALYNNGLSPASREIVQNEYASLLLETGLVGIFLFAVLIVMAVKTFLKLENAGVLLALVLSYAVSLLFFSGLTNALQIVLLPGILAVVYMKW